MADDPFTCDSCGLPLPPQKAIGRRRKRHEDCLAPGQVSGPKRRKGGPKQKLKPLPEDIPEPYVEPLPVPAVPPREDLPLGTWVIPEDLISDADLETGAGPLETATTRSLEEFALTRQPGAVAVTLLARRIDRATLRDTGAAYAALTKEYRAAYAEVTLSAAKEAAAAAARDAPGDPMDEVARRRAEKASGA